MNLGDLYTAPWGRYVVHRLSPLVLRDLDRSNACVMPIGELVDYKATGQTFTSALQRPTPHLPCPRATDVAPASAEPTPLPPPASPPEVARSSNPAAAGAGAGGGSIPEPAWWLEFVSAPQYGLEPLTLGGQRPGTGTFILPASPCLWWRPCLTRELETGNEHCWYMAMSNEPTFYCWECRVGRPAPASMSAEPDHGSFSVTPPTAENAAAFRMFYRQEMMAPDPKPKHQGKFGPRPVGAPDPAFRNTEPTPLPKIVNDPKDELGNFATASKGSLITPPPHILWPLVARPPYRPATVDDWKEECRERAALIEYCGGETRQHAERMALAIVGPKPQPNAWPT